MLRALDVVVFPMRVGVNLSTPPFAKQRLSIPHASGGEPSNVDLKAYMNDVFPMRVGVNPGLMPLATAGTSIPHASGGEPIIGLRYI